MTEEDCCIRKEQMKLLHYVRLRSVEELKSGEEDF